MSIIKDNLDYYLDGLNPYSYPSTGVTVSDLSGNGRDVTLYNGMATTWNQKGYWTPDGTDDWMGRLTTDYDVNTTHNINFILKTSTYNQDNILLRYQTSDNNKFIECDIFNGTWRYFHFDVPSNSYTLFGATIQSPLETWVHLSINADVANGNIDFYENGQQITTDINFNYNTQVPLGDLLFPTGLTDTRFWLIGYLAVDTDISSTYAYNTSLTSTQIQQNFNSIRNRYQILENQTYIDETNFYLTSSKNNLYSYKFKSMSGVPVRPNIVEDGLITYLDPKIRYSYDGSGTTWSDLKYNYNFTALNGAETNWNSNGYFELDGTDDSFIQQPVAISNNYTISTWFYLDSGTTSNALFDNQDNTLNLGSWSRIDIGTQWIINIRTSGGNSRITETSVVPSANTWYNATVVVDDDSLRTSVYINYTGTPLTVLTKNFASPISGITNSDNIYYNIGRRGSTYLGGYQGPFMIYNKALSQSEVEQNYNALKGRFGL